MNQEIKDTLVELTRQADKLERMEVEQFSGLQCVRRAVQPTPSDFLTAQRYRALVRHVEELHKALGDITEQYLNETQLNEVPDRFPEDEPTVKAARKLLNT